MEPNQSQYHPPTVWIIYGALIMSQIVYVLVGGFVLSPPEEPSTELIFPVVIGLASLTISVLSFLIGNFIKGDYFTKCIIRWSLSESIAIFGLVLVQMTGNKTYLVGFIIWSLALMGVHAPSQKEFESTNREKE